MFKIVFSTRAQLILNLIISKVKSKYKHIFPYSCTFLWIQNIFVWKSLSRYDKVSRVGKKTHLNGSVPSNPPFENLNIQHGIFEQNKIKKKDREVERETERDTERQRDKETERQRDRETERERGRERERDTEREREGERETGRH